MGEGRGEPLDQRNKGVQGGRARFRGNTTAGLDPGSVRNYKVTVAQLCGAVGPWQSQMRPIPRAREVKCWLVEVQNNWKPLKGLHGQKLNEEYLYVVCNFL